MASEQSSNNFLLIGMILMTILFLVTALGLVQTWMGWEEMVEKVDKAEAEVEKIQEDYDRALKERTELRTLIHGKEAKVEIPMVRKKFFVEAGAQLEKIMEQEDLLPEDARAKLDEIKEQEKKATGEYYEEHGHFQEVVVDLLRQLSAIVPVVPKLRMQRKRKSENLDAERANHANQVTKIRQEKERVQEKWEQEQEKNLELEKKYDEEKREHIDDVARLKQQIEENEEKFKLEETKLLNKISELELKINDLVKKKERTLAETTADGEITYADNKLGFAWINIGSRDGLRLGLQFEVFQFVKGGQKKLKGLVEVRKLEDDMSQVAILTAYRYTNPENNQPYLNPEPIPGVKPEAVLPRTSDPVVKGDLIRSPFFDREEKQIFVFIGDERGITNPKYNLSDLKRKIEETGSTISPTITIETDFAIALGNANSPEFDEEFEKAVQFGIIIMRETDLIEYLGRR